MKRVFKIFISSTFGDFQLERDIIKSYLVPKLNEEFQDFSVKVELVDLRWGIDLTKSSEEKILQICFDEIENAHPFFLSFVGSKYGWQPPIEMIKRVLSPRPQLTFIENCSSENSFSITELEILLAMNSEKIKSDNCLFCLRSDESYLNLEEDKRSIYIEESKLHLVNRLKNKIKKYCEKSGEGHILYYKGDLRYSNYRIGPDTEFLMNRMFEFFYNKITSIIKEETYEPISSTSIDTQAFIFSKLRFFVSQDVHINRIIKCIEDRHPMDVIIEGEGGVGKSCLLAHIYVHLLESEKFIPLYYSTELFGGTIEDVLSVFYEQLRLKLNNIGAYEDAVIENLTLNDMVSFATNKGLIPIGLIDNPQAFNRGTAISFHLFPQDLRKIITTRNSHDIENTNQIKEIIRLNGFNEIEAHRLIDKTLSTMSFDLPDVQKNKLINQKFNLNLRQGYGISPLWLNLSLKLMVSLNRFDFSFSRNIDSSAIEEGEFKQFLNMIQKSNVESPTQYLGILIESLPIDIRSLLNFIAQKSYSQFGEKNLGTFIAATSIFRKALPFELANSLYPDLNQIDYLILRYWIEGLLYNKTSDGNLYCHDTIKSYLTPYQSLSFKKP